MKALYRKYRPKNLTEVVGQDHITEPLGNALKSGKFSHAYLFIGPRGCGKTSVARIFAHEINHFNYELEDNYVDIIEIDAATNTKAENMRELCERVPIAPTQGKYKVYIIDEIQMLSSHAFNALLKTLEEPPKHAIFIMATTNPEKIPITIISRAQVYNFELASSEVMQKHLRKVADQEGITITDEALEIIVERGGGSFRDSLSLLDQISVLSEGEITAETIIATLRLPTTDQTAKLLEAYRSGDLTTITDELQAALADGTDPSVLAERLMHTIINHPEPALLPLLSALTKVEPPFADAKLLLALTASSGVPVSPPTRPAGPSPRAAGTATRAAALRTPAETPVAPEPNTEFSWDAFLSAVKSASASVHNRLQKCPHLFDPATNTLHLYPEKAVDKNIFTHPNNRPILMQCASPTTLTIHEIDEQFPTQNSSTFSQISAIMGKVQEVKNDGEIPF